jgi:hypothetical protein
VFAIALILCVEVRLDNSLEMEYDIAMLFVGGKELLHDNY